MVLFCQPGSLINAVRQQTDTRRMKTRKRHLHGEPWGHYFIYYTKTILKNNQEREFDILDTETSNKAVIIKIG